MTPEIGKDSAQEAPRGTTKSRQHNKNNGTKPMYSPRGTTKSKQHNKNSRTKAMYSLPIEMQYKMTPGIGRMTPAIGKDSAQEAPRGTTKSKQHNKNNRTKPMYSPRGTTKSKQHNKNSRRQPMYSLTIEMQYKMTPEITTKSGHVHFNF